MCSREVSDASLFQHMLIRVWVAWVQGPAVHGRTPFDRDHSDSCLLLSGIVSCPCTLDGGGACYRDTMAHVILPPVDIQTSSSIIKLMALNVLKLIVLLKRKVQTSFAHTQVVLNLYNLLSSAEHKR